MLISPVLFWISALFPRVINPPVYTVCLILSSFVCLFFSLVFFRFVWEPFFLPLFLKSVLLPSSTVFSHTLGALPDKFIGSSPAQYVQLKPVSSAPVMSALSISAELLIAALASQTKRIPLSTLPYANKHQHQLLRAYLAERHHSNAVALAKET